MALESTTYINGLIATNPTSSDNVGDGDNHIRLLKSTILATMPNVAGAITGTHTQLNTAVSLTQAATDQATANTLAKRDASGNIRAGTFYGNVVGNVTGTVSGGSSTAGSATSAGTAAQAAKWTTARTITLAGDLSGSTSIDGQADVTLTATVADDSHNHTIANIDNLQTELNRIEGTVSGSAVASAGKWTTARTLALTGGVTGSTLVDGDENHTIATTVADNSHNHTIANVTGLQTALNGKLSTTGTAAAASKWATPRNIALTGDVTGSVAVDGNTDHTISTTVVNNSHTHTIANITDLTTTLAAKVNTSSFTGASILSLLLGSDGTGSNLDADKLDSYEGAKYFRVVSKNLASNGYIKFSIDGVTFQITWGSVTSNDESRNQYHAYHTAFDNATWQIVVSHGYHTNDSNFHGLGSTAPTASGFYLTNLTQNATCRYIAIGN